MKIINQTRYDTAALRTIFSQCANRVKQDYQLDWPKINGLTVTVVYARRNFFVSGRGHINHGRMKIAIPSKWIPLFDQYPQEHERVGHKTGELVHCIAATFIHELGHNLGVRKHVKGNHYWAAYTIEHQYEDFIYGIAPISLIAPPKEKPDVRIRRYERAVENLAAAETRLRRAKTLYQKWSAKKTYYERTVPELVALAKPRSRR